MAIFTSPVCSRADVLVDGPSPSPAPLPAPLLRTIGTYGRITPPPRLN